MCDPASSLSVAQGTSTFGETNRRDCRLQSETPTALQRRICLVYCADTADCGKKLKASHAHRESATSHRKFPEALFFASNSLPSRRPWPLILYDYILAQPTPKSPRKAPPSFEYGSAQKRRETESGHVPVALSAEDEGSDKENSLDETIDELDSRPKKSLPARSPAVISMSTDSFKLPDPHATEGLPTDVDKNPHLHTTQRGPKPADIPEHTAIPWTQAIYPRAVIPYADLVANIDPLVRREIDANPEKYLAVVPYGAGKKFLAENPRICEDILKFLRSLGYPYEGLDDGDDDPLELVIPKKAGPAGGTFAKPWTLLLSNASDAAREFLLWFQTFAVNTSVTFHVLAFDKDLMSWVIMNISGVAAGIPGSAREHAVLATNSFELTFIDSNDGNGDEAPRWQLTGKPVSDDPLQQARYIAITMSIPFLVGLNVLEVGKRYVNCGGCKNVTHVGHACPLPLTDNWYGPVPPPPAPKNPREDHGSASQGPPKRHNGGNGGNSRGGNGGGNKSQGRNGGGGGSSRNGGGWTKVTRY
ncbi:hypothetical protein DFH06DRAFT_1311712 [Mycena polygramma]|nr:hypothetical protein DFH06DRAFT_1311712 [Mycena polygramma]